MSQPPATARLYRPNVGLIVFNRQGQVLMGERLNVPGSWQFPQGGIDEGEAPQVAACRELYEEVGITVGDGAGDARLVYGHEPWLYYEFPDGLNLSGKWAKYRGQKQQWFAFYWDQPATLCNLDTHQREFTKVQYLPLANCADTIVPFKKPIYQELITVFTPVISDYLANL